MDGLLVGRYKFLETAAVHFLNFSEKSHGVPSSTRGAPGNGTGETFAQNLLLRNNRLPYLPTVEMCHLFH